MGIFFRAGSIQVNNQWITKRRNPLAPPTFRRRYIKRGLLCMKHMFRRDSIVWKYTVLLSGFLSHNTKDLISIMTVTDLLASKMAHEDRCYMSKVAEAVKDVVHMAATNKRLVLGAMPSAEFLGEEADSVALCLLLENKSDDVLISIQHKLVEAYCWENDIPLLKVDSEDKVRKILSPHTDPNNNEPDDLSCILVKNADKMSSSESMLADFFDYIIKNEIEPFPVITLPE